MCFTMKVCNDIDVASCISIARNLNTFKKDYVVVIVGQTSIEYIGRASSYAHPANRMVIVKPDGSLLIHESTRVEPLNWQPPKSSSYFECVGEKLRLKSIREKPYEEVVVEFIDIDFVKVCKLSSTKLRVVGREADIVRLIASNPQLLDEDLTTVGVDVVTPYGKVDVLLRKDDTLVVVEVKNERVGISAVAQLKRYVEYYLSQRYKVEGVLVAPEVSHEALVLLNREGFKFVAVHELIGTIKSGTTLEKFINIDKT